MKKTNRNQNMPDQDLRNNENVNTGSIKNQIKQQGRKERFDNSNLQQPLQQGKQQRYDDKTGTVENGIG